MTKWTSLQKEVPNSTQLVAIWRKEVRKFFIGWFKPGPVRSASMCQKSSSESHHWQSSSGNKLKSTDKDWWFPVPNLEITEVFGIDPAPNKAEMKH